MQRKTKKPIHRRRAELILMKSLARYIYLYLRHYKSLVAHPLLEFAETTKAMIA